MKRPKPYIPRESEIQKSAIALLKTLGWIVHRRNVGGFKKGDTFIRLNSPGMADLWGTMPDGRRFECEIKRPGNRPTPKQLAWLKDQNNAHCAAFWIDSTAILERIAKCLSEGQNVRFRDASYEFDLI